MQLKSQTSLMFLVHGWSAVINSTCRSRHRGCNHRADSPSPPPCPGRSSGAGPQRRGGPHTDWAPGRKHREKKLNTQYIIHNYNTDTWMCCKSLNNSLETHLNSSDGLLKVLFVLSVSRRHKNRLFLPIQTSCKRCQVIKRAGLKKENKSRLVFDCLIFGQVKVSLTFQLLSICRGYREELEYQWET